MSYRILNSKTAAIADYFRRRDNHCPSLPQMFPGLQRSYGKFPPFKSRSHTKRGPGRIHQQGKGGA